MQQFARNVTALLRSRRFFPAVMLFFAVESLWIAFSARYPQAFDEQFHFGLIKLYAHHWSPFLTSQPPDADRFGAIVRDPSYLYHYLMSFPYRLMALCIHAEAAQVIILRLMDVALFITGFAVFKRILLRAGISSAFVNLSIFIFTLIPIVPQLAAQVNYDDLLFPLSAVTCLLVFGIYDALRTKRVDMRRILLLLAVCLLASLVKYAFLPIFLAAAVFVIVVAVRQFRPKRRELWRACRQGFGALSRSMRVGLVLFVVAASALFAQRYIVNVMRYGSPIPDCGQVLSTKECLNYGPWHRNYDDAQQPHAHVSKNPIRYSGEWFFGLYYRLFFAINGDYTNYVPLPLPSLAAIILFFASILVVAAERRAIFRGNAYLLFFLAIILTYCSALWLDNYKDFLRTGQPVAINGRYLLPVLLPAAAILGRAMSLALRRHNAKLAKPILAAAVSLLFISGGGVLTFISRSDDSWYWPNTVVVHANHAAHRILSPILIEKGGKYY